MLPLKCKVTDTGQRGIYGIPATEVCTIIALLGSDDHILYLVILPSHSSYPANRVTAEVIKNLRAGDDLTCAPDLFKYEGAKVDWFDQSHVEILESVAVKAPVTRENDGCNCKVCGNFCMMAEPNDENGTFTCYSCRTIPLRRYY